MSAFLKKGENEHNYNNDPRLDEFIEIVKGNFK